MDLSQADRIIVAADYSPKEFSGIEGVRDQVLRLGRELEGLGVYIKVNSVLRAVGYPLIAELRNLGLKTFADLKLNDIPNTMQMDAELLAERPPELLTVMCSSGVDGMIAVQKVLGGTTEVLGVTVLTSLGDEESQAIFGCGTLAGVLRFARMAQLAKLGGLILSPHETRMLAGKKELNLTLNTPGIRPVWSIIPKDDQTRIMTPQQAFDSGAHRIVIGRPITQAGPNSDGLPQSPREAVLRTLEEISS